MRHIDIGIDIGIDMILVWIRWHIIVVYESYGLKGKVDWLAVQVLAHWYMLYEKIDGTKCYTG